MITISKLPTLAATERPVLLTAVRTAVLTAMLASGSSVASAVGFPERPVRLVAASAAGGGTDIIGRMLAQGLGDTWSQAVVVDNRPGGGGVIATDIVAKALPDGHTLLMQSLGITFAPALYRKLPFDVRRDIAPVTVVGSQPFVLTVNNDVPVKSAADLIKLAKAKPGTLRFASGGVSGASHLGMELFKVVSATDIVHVPYKGTGPGTTALLSGEVQMTIAGIGTIMPHAKANRVRALAVTGSKRSPAAPELPTVSENGLPGYEFDVWYGVFAPGKTPRARLQLLNDGTTRALREPETARRFAAGGIDVIASGLDETRRYVEAEIVKWGKVIKEAGIKAD